MQKEQIKQLVDRITGTQIKEPNQRVKAIVDRMLLDLFNVIDDFDVQPEEFWSALGYLTELGQRNEYSLLSAGLGIDHYFDVRLDEKEARSASSRAARRAPSKGRSTSPERRSARARPGWTTTPTRARSCSWTAR